MGGESAPEKLATADARELPPTTPRSLAQFTATASSPSPSTIPEPSTGTLTGRFTVITTEGAHAHAIVQPQDEPNTAPAEHTMPDAHG